MYSGHVKYVVALIDTKQLDKHPLVLFTQTQIAAVLVALQRQPSFSMNGTIFE